MLADRNMMRDWGIMRGRSGHASTKPLSVAKPLPAERARFTCPAVSGRQELC
jgi:hypothetical protein